MGFRENTRVFLCSIRNGLVLAGFLFLVASPNTGRAFSGSGTGVAGDPYVIVNVGQLQEMNDSLGAVYVLGGDIDASATAGWNGGGGFGPVGSSVASFVGSLDGMNHTITDLHLDWPSSDTIGLFGTIGPGATIANVWIANSSAEGNQGVGLLAGVNAGAIANCHTSGFVAGVGTVGGALGMNQGSATNCHSAAEVTSTSDNAGGFVGINVMSGMIQRCHATGNVGGLAVVGGFAGHNSVMATIVDCYSLGSVSGEVDTAGFCGTGFMLGTMASCYSAGAVSGVATPGGFVAESGGGTATDCFWDTQASGQSISALGIGKTTAQMKQRATFDPPWNFSGVWSIHEGRSYPFHFRGSALQDIEVQPGTLAFGTRYVNQGATTKEIFLINMGEPDLTITSVSLAGDADFSIDADTGDATLTSGTVRVVRVAFDPIATGAKTATLTIQSNDPDHPSLDVALTGEGFNTAPLARAFPAHQAVSLDGWNEIVMLGGNAALCISGDVTLEAWIRPNTVSADQDIVSWGGQGAGEGDNYLYMMRLRDTGDLGVLHRYGNLNPAIVIDFDTNLPANVWTHVAVVRDTAAKTYTAYVNGAFVGTQSYTDNPTGGEVGVATAQIGAHANWDYVFDGRIDDVRVWNAQRTQGDIQSNRSHELNGDEPNLAGYWKFNEANSARVTPDATGHGNDGTLMNQATIYGPSEAMGVLADFSDTTDEDSNTTVTFGGYDADGDTLTAYLTQLPAAGEGRLYQLAGPGPVRGAEITSVSTPVADANLRVVYAPANRVSTYNTTLRWRVYDGLVYSNNDTTYTLTVTADADGPALAANTGMNAERGAATVIAASALETTDMDTPPADLIYTVTAFPGHGTLKVGATELHPQPTGPDTFTQAHINAGQLTYTHDGATPPLADAFTFTVTDGASPALGPETFDIDIVPPTSVEDWNLLR